MGCPMNDSSNKLYDFGSLENWPKPRRVKFPLIGSCERCGVHYSFIPGEEEDPKGHKDIDACHRRIVRQVMER